MGKVMSYEDLVAKCAEKEAAKQAKEKGKGKCGRKRKSGPEGDWPEVGRKAKVARMSEAPEAKSPEVRMSEAPELKTPEARMS